MRWQLRQFNGRRESITKIFAHETYTKSTKKNRAFRVCAWAIFSSTLLRNCHCEACARHFRF